MTPKDIAKELRKGRIGKKVVLCSGSFDLIHYEHIEFLEQSKKHGDILIVGVNSDTNVSGRKGPGRPIFSEKKRLRLILALEVVDYAFIRYPSRYEIIPILKPDVLILNNDKEISLDYKKRTNQLRKKFPDVNFVKLKTKNRSTISTTKLIQKIKMLP